jgi:hypothetical protein
MMSGQERKAAVDALNQLLEQDWPPSTRLRIRNFRDDILAGAWPKALARVLVTVVSSEVH